MEKKQETRVMENGAWNPHQGPKFSETPGNLEELCQYIGSLNQPALIYLAARPGVGKTSLVLSMLRRMERFSDKTAVLFSLDMSRERVCMRLAAQEGAAQWGQEKDHNILINDDPSLTVVAMKAWCRAVDNLGLVVIDYLQLIDSVNGKLQTGKTRIQIEAEIGRALRDMAVELNVPVLCLYQLHHAAESNAESKPGLLDFDRYNAELKKDADMIFFLWRKGVFYYLGEGVYEDADSTEAELFIAKNCYGEQDIVIPLEWRPKFMDFD